MSDLTWSQLTQAHQFHAIFMQGRTKTVTQLAREGRVTRSYFTRVLRLAFLSPQITKAILRNRHPLDLSAKRIANDVQLPIDWTKQHALLGIQP